MVPPSAISISGLAKPSAYDILMTIKSKRFFSLYNKVKDRKSTRLNSSHGYISYAVFCLKKKKHLMLKQVSLNDEPNSPLSSQCNACSNSRYAIFFLFLLPNLACTPSQSSQPVPCSSSIQ